jgi:hypothetical protein
MGTHSTREFNAEQELQGSAANDTDLAKVAGLGIWKASDIVNPATKRNEGREPRIAGNTISMGRFALRKGRHQVLSPSP